MIPNSTLLGSLEKLLVSENISFTNAQYQLSVKLINYFVNEGITEDHTHFSLITSLRKLSDAMGCSKTFMNYTLKILRDINLIYPGESSMYICDLKLLDLQEGDFLC